jgi:hypothetical protein
MNETNTSKREYIADYIAYQVAFHPLEKYDIAPSDIHKCIPTILKCLEDYRLFYGDIEL